MAHMPDRSLSIDVRSEGRAAVVVVHGSAGMGDVDKMRLVLEELIDSETSPIVLDLGDLDFICSSVLGAIIYAHLSTRHYDGRILLTGPKPPVQKLLEATCLTKLFPVFPTSEQALRQG